MGERNVPAVVDESERNGAMTEHAVVIAGAGPTGMMLAGELTLAKVDVAIVEPRLSQELESSRAGGLHSRTIEVLDHGNSRSVPFAGAARAGGGVLDDHFGHQRLSTRHNYGLALWQNRIEEILAGWVDELAVPIYRGREVTGSRRATPGSTSRSPTVSRCEPSIWSVATEVAAGSVRQPVSSSSSGTRQPAT
jgi:2-polyprenyl-6-methoxyphenol hydroxylase-like FAD-dependent oxidoreductase